MKKEMVREVVEAMVVAGVVDVVCGIPVEERIEEIVELTFDEVNEQRHQKSMESVTSILKEFKEYVEAEKYGPVIENGVEREMTLQDHIDFIRSEWEKVEEALYDQVGINLEEEV